MKVIYEKHPVTPERVAELAAQGYMIIDAKFEHKSEAQALDTQKQKKTNKAIAD